MVHGHTVAAVIVAAGASRRMGFDKLAYPLDGGTVLEKSVRAFDTHPAIDEILLVAGENAPQAALLAAACAKPAKTVAGGATRVQSVRAGLDAVNAEYVAIHDGARPFATRELIERCLQSAIEHGAATAAVRAKDTIKVSAQDGSIESTPDRSRLYLTQTPQIFSLALYKKAVRQAQQEKLDFTDDCQLVEHIGQKVWLSEGDYQNIKITTPEDMVLAEAIARQQDTQQRGEKREMEIRAGHGYDVHRLVEGRKLILGGVTIPWEKGLLGHSDADVLTHAVMDALLGAAALGDIGRYFPDTDPRYAGADSLELLRHVVKLLCQEGYAISNIDATVIAQRPKLKDFIPQMQQNIAAACGIAPAQVNVKATTEENLGFTGSGEGMSAHSVCILTR